MYIPQSAMAEAETLPNKFVCLNTARIADGTMHNCRAVAVVVVVDHKGEVKLHKTIKQEKKVVSYITPLTGLREGDLDQGERLADVIEEVKALLGPDVVIVGQRPEMDINPLKLKEGVHYKESVELGEMFKTYNSYYKDYNYYSLKHEADTLLGPGNWHLYYDTRWQIFLL